MIQGSCLNVDDYGAVGDGVADDSNALLLAFQAAVTSGIPVSFGAGKTYLCDLNIIDVTLAENSSLTVYGNNALLKQRTAWPDIGGNPALIIVRAATSLSTTTTLNVYDLNFDGSVQPVDWLSSLGTGSNALGVRDIGTIEVDGCKAEKFWFSSVFQFLRTHYVNVTNCYMKEVGGHVLLDDAGSANGDPIIFYDNPNGAVYRVADCTFIGYPTTPYQGGYPHNLSRAGVVFEAGNGVNPAFVGIVDNCYFDGFSIVVHCEHTAFSNITISNVTAINGWALFGGFGRYFRARIDNCSFKPIVSGAYNGINGFAMTDIGASDFSISVRDSYYRPVSANRMCGDYYSCVIDDFSHDNFACGGTTAAFYNCVFNGVDGGPTSDYQFFGGTYEVFDGCTFNGLEAGTDYKLSFESRDASALKIFNCTFNDCGLWVNGSAGGETIIDGCDFNYTDSIASLTVVDSGTQTINIKNSRFIADDSSSGSKLNSSATGNLAELSNSYVKNLTAYTVNQKPSMLVNSRFEFASSATPTAQGFYGRFGDYVVENSCVFISPTGTPITLATPDRRVSSSTKDASAGTVSGLSDI